jgi:hypothetical protein
MAFLGETILLPMQSPLPPNTFAFFKRISIPSDSHVLHLDPDLKVKVYQNKGPQPLRYLVTQFPESFVTEINGYVTSTNLNVNYTNRVVYASFNNYNDVIVEVDEVPGRIINPNLENIDQDALVAQIKAHPEIEEKIPQVLWNSHTFLQKITDAKLGRLIPDYARTTARLKGVNYYGNETGTFNTRRFPSDVSNSINQYLDVDQSKDTLLPSIISAKREKERELSEVKGHSELKEDNARAEGFFRRIFSRSGGKRRKRRTRRFKK